MNVSLLLSDFALSKYYFKSIRNGSCSKCNTSNNDIYFNLFSSKVRFLNIYCYYWNSSKYSCSIYIFELIIDLINESNN
jgi:hypothetical protein